MTDILTALKAECAVDANAAKARAEAVSIIDLCRARLAALGFDVETFLTRGDDRELALRLALDRITQPGMGRNGRGETQAMKISEPGETPFPNIKPKSEVAVLLYGRPHGHDMEPL